MLHFYRFFWFVDAVYESSGKSTPSGFGQNTFYAAHNATLYFGIIVITMSIAVSVAISIVVTIPVPTRTAVRFNRVEQDGHRAQFLLFIHLPYVAQMMFFGGALANNKNG